MNLRGQVFGGVAFAAPLLLYFFTLAPTVTFEDSGEFIAAAKHLGVVHAPGYPLWSLLVYPFTLIPWGSVAERVHFFSALCGAGTCWFVYRAATRIVGAHVPALAAALALAASEIFWSQSVIAEVYTLNSLVTMWLVDVGLRWREDGAPRHLYTMALGVGLGLGNHPLLGPVAAALFVWLVAVDWRAVLQWRVVAGGTLLLALGLSVYGYIPLRAASNPPVNVGLADTPEKFFDHVSRRAYAAESGLRSKGSAADDMAHSEAAWRGAFDAFGAPLALLALTGLVLWPRDRLDVLAMTVGIALLNTVATNLALSAHYNFWWDHVHRVYYLPAHAMAALWIAAAVQRILEEIGERSTFASVVATVLLAAVVVGETFASYPGAHRQGDDRARRYAIDLLQSAREGAGYLPLHDEVTYPLTYMRWVEGVRPDVKILSAQFGWNPNEPPTEVLIGSPLTDAMRDAFPELRDYYTLPTGIAYRVVSRAAAARFAPRDFEPLPEPPVHLANEVWPKDDPFAETVQRRYAVYHTRVAVKRWNEGRREEAQREFTRAEALDPGDAFAEWTLFQAYRMLRIHSEKQRPLLEAALANFDAKVDAAIDRYYPVDRRAIERALERTAAP